MSIPSFRNALREMKRPKPLPPGFLVNPRSKIAAASLWLIEGPLFEIKKPSELASSVICLPLPTSFNQNKSVINNIDKDRIDC